MSSRCVHVVACVRISCSFLWLNSIPLFHCMQIRIYLTHVLFIPLTADGQLACFHLLAIVNHAAMNIGGFFFSSIIKFKKKTTKNLWLPCFLTTFISQRLRTSIYSAQELWREGYEFSSQVWRTIQELNQRKTFNEAFLSGGSWHAHQSKASHLFLQTRSPLTRPDIWVCLQLKVSDSPVKTIHLSAGQMLSKAFLHLSGAEQRGKKPQGI